MPRPPRAYVAHPRHPVTRKQLRISARSPRELDALVHRIDTLRSELRLGVRTPKEVDRILRRVARGTTTVARAGELFLSRTDIAENTRRRVRSFLAAPGRELAARDLDDLDGPALERWIGKLRATLGPSSVQQAWKTLRQLVLYATRRGWIGSEPWGTWKPPRMAAPSSHGRPQREAARCVAELVAIIDAACALDREREKAGLLGDLEGKCSACALLGLRQGELAGLRWTDINPGAQTVAIERQWTGAPTKSKRLYVLRALPELFPVFARLCERLRARGLFSPTGPVFPMRESLVGQPRHYASGECLTRRDFRAVVVRANLPHPFRWSPHSLRDTFVTLEAGATHDLHAVAARSRHVSIGSLVRYLRSMSRDPAAPGFSLSQHAPGPPLLAEGAPVQPPK